MPSHFFLEGSEIIPLPFFSPHKHCIHPRDLGRVAPEPINQQVFTEPSRVPSTVSGAGGGGGGLPKEHVAGSPALSKLTHWWGVRLECHAPEKFKDETGMSSALVCLHISRLEADDSGVTYNFQLNSVPVCHDCVCSYLLTHVLLRWNLPDL